MLMVIQTPVAFAQTRLPAEEDAHVRARLTSPERARVMEEARRAVWEQKDRQIWEEQSRQTLPEIPQNPPATRHASSSPAEPDSPRDMTKAALDVAAGLVGLPGSQAIPEDELSYQTSYNDWLASPSLPLDRGPSFYLGDNSQRPKDYRNELSSFTSTSLNYGLGLLNTLGQSALDPFYGKLRMQFSANDHGKFFGEADVLLPIYDTTHSSIFTQFGARSLWNDRWNANIGLGQRWYPQAQGEGDSLDSGKWMLGYNIFYDYDIRRSHQRGGMGIEAQYDIIKLSSNYYLPLSSWRSAKGSDLDNYQERPAKGWDIRAKGALPFYRNIAITGAFSRWYGDEVGMFGSSRREHNPKVWSYGLEYRPIPLLSLYAEQSRTEHGRSDTNFGIRINYSLGTPFMDALKPATLTAESQLDRREFIDRENKIILAYRQKGFTVALNKVEYEVPITGGTLHVDLFTTSGSPATSAIWQGSALPFMVHSDVNGADFVFPPYRPVRAKAKTMATAAATPVAGAPTYQIQAIAMNDFGQTASTGAATIWMIDPSTLPNISGTTPSGPVKVGDNIPLSVTVPGGAGQDIVWVIVGGTGTGTLNPARSTTDGSGTATSSFTPTTPGTVIIQAQRPDGTVVGQTTLNAEPQTPTTPPDISGGAGDNPVTVGDNLPLSVTDPGAGPGKDVIWIIVGGTGGGTLNPPRSTTDGSDTATSSFTPTKPGTVIIQAQRPDGTVIGETTLVVKPDTTGWTLQVSSTADAVESGANLTLTAKLLDKNGNPVPGATINWSSAPASGSSGSGTLSGANSTTDSSGNASITLTGNNVGKVTVTAAYSDDTSVSGTKDITVSAYALDVANPGSVKKGESTPITATLTNGGAPVDNAAISWSIVSGNGTLGSNTVNTDSNGKSANTFIATQTGTVTLRATYQPPVGPAITKDITFTVDDAYKLELSASSTTTPNGGTITLNATLSNGGTPVDSAAITWRVVSGGSGDGTLASASSTTDSSGHTQNVFTGTKSGTVTVEAAFGSITQQITGTITPVYAITLAPSSPAVNNGSTSTFTATLTDNGTPVSGSNIDWTLTPGSPGNGTLSSASSSTDSSGNATTNFTANQSGSVTIKAALSTDSSISAQTTATINAVYALSLHATPTSVANGGQTQLAATLTDAGVPVNNAAINFSITAGPGAGTLSAASANTDGSGVANDNFTANKSGTVTVQASYGSLNSQAVITVDPDLNLTLTADSTTIQNGSSTGLTATLTDHGTAVNGVQINWSVTAGSPGNGTLNTTASSTDTNGKASNILTGTQSGTVTVTATYGSLSRNITVTIKPTYSLDLNPTSTTLGNGSSQSFTATLRDNGAPVSGQNINWTVTSGAPGNGTLSDSSSATSSTGGATSTFTATESGTATLKATLASDSTVTTQASITISPKYTLAVTPATQSISTGDNAPLTATLLDNGAPVPNAAITWSFSGTGNGSLPASSTTDTSGKANNTFVSTVSGTVDVTATYSGLTSQAQITINPKYNISVSASPTSINNGANSTVTANVTDGTLPAQSGTVDWSIVGGTGSGTLAQSSSAISSGQANVTLTGTKSGTVIVRGTIGSSTSDVTITVNPVYSITIDPVSPSIANGSDQVFTATLRDNGVAVPNMAVNWTDTPGTGDGTFVQLSPNTDSNGQVQARLSATKSGTVTVKATLASSSSVSDQTTATITPVYTLSASASPNDMANGASSTITATLLDNGKPVPSTAVTWTLIKGTGDGTLSPASSNTDATGKATSTFQATLKGKVTVQAAANGQTAQADININPAYTISIDPTSATMNNGGTQAFTVTVLDNGVPVSGAQINWGALPSPSGNGTMHDTTTSTDASGKATTSFIATASGQVKVDAAMNDNTAVTASSMVTINPVYNLRVRVDQPSISVAGGKATFTAILTDNDTPVSGQTINWSITGGTGSGTLDTTTSTTDSNGRANDILTAATSGTVTVQATFGSLNQTGTVTITPSYTLSVTPKTVTISNGTSTTLDATLLDNGKAVSGQSIDWSITSGASNGSLSGASSTTDSSGKASITFNGTATGSSTVQAAFSGLTDTSNITISASFALNLSGSSTMVNGSTITDLVATLTDGGSPKSGATINWTIVSGGTGSGTLSAASSSTDTNGKATDSFTASKSGTVTIQAEYSGNTAQKTITITPKYTISLSPTNASIANGSTQTFTATLLDNGVPAPNQQINWSTVSGTGSAGRDHSTSATDASGQAQVTLTGTKSGSVTLSATLSSDSSITTQTPVTVTPTYNIQIKSSVSTIANGDTSTITATLLDGTTPVPSQDITWSISGGTGQGSLSTASSSTNASGEATTVLTGVAGGTVTVNAAFGSTTAQTTVTVTPKYNLSLTATPTAIKNGATSALKATLLDGSTPVNNATLTWSKSGTGNGTLPDSTTTDASGNSNNTFTANANGSVTVQVAYSGVTAQATITVTPSYTIAITATPTTISNGGTSSITATLLDNGTPVSGQTINWGVSGTGNGTFTTVSATTGGSGQASTTFTGTRSGLATVSATLSTDSTITANTGVTINPSYAISVSPNPDTMSNGAKHTFTATLTDNGTPVSGQGITWSVTSGSPGNGSLSTASGTTDANGQVSTDFTANQSGTATLKAAMTSSSSVSGQSSITINPAYTLNVSSSPSSINNGATSTITATLLDNGTPVSGQSVSWSIASGGSGTGTVSPTSATTDSSGNATTTLTATKSGTVNVQAQVAGQTGQTTVTVNPVYALSITPSPATLKNGANQDFTVNLTDNGTPVSGQSIDWTVTSGSPGNGSLNRSNSTTDNSGNAIVTFTASQSGTATLKAAMTSSSSVTAQSSITINPSYTLDVSASPNSINNGATSTITATLLDNGTAVSGQSVSWSIASGGSGDGTVAPTSATTDSSGKATTTLTASKSGTVNVQAQVAGQTGQTTVTVNPVYAITVSPNTATMSNGGSSNFTATLTDNGTPVSGQGLTWSVISGSPGNGTVSSSSGSTDSNGQLSVTFNANQSGTATLKAAMSSNSSVSGQSSITINPAYTLSVSPSPSSINNGATSTITATLLDNGQPVSGQALTWSVMSGSSGNGSFSPTSGTTDANGKVTTTLTASKSGTIAIQAQAAGQNGQTTVTVNPVYAISLSPAPTLGTNVGTSTTFTATLTDNGTPVSGQTIGWTVTPGSPGNGTVSSSSSATDASGKATVTFSGTQVGKATLTATVAGNSSVNAQCVITMSAVYSVVMSPTTATVKNGATTSPFTITVYDGGTSGGNQTPAVGMTVNMSVTSGSPGNGTTSVTSFTTDANGQGQVTFTANQSGSATMTATLAGQSRTASANITITPAYALSLSPSPVTMSNTTTQTFTATLTDNGAAVSGKTINWTTTAGTGSGTLGATSSSTDSTGKATVVFTAAKSGSASVSATLSTDSTVTASSSVTISPSYTLSVSLASNSISNGSSTTVTGTLMDGSTPVSGQTVNWSRSTGSGNTANGTFSPTSGVTDANGKTTTTFTANTSGAMLVQGTVPALNNTTGKSPALTVRPVWSMSWNPSPANVASGQYITINVYFTDNGVAADPPIDNYGWSNANNNQAWYTKQSTGYYTVTFQGGVQGSASFTFNIGGTNPWNVSIPINVT